MVINNKLLSRLILLVFVIAVSGCGSKKPAKIDYGEFEGNVYRNEYFGMTAEVPVEWYICDRETINRVNETGKQIIAGDDENMRAIIDASNLVTVNLFQAFEYPVGAPVPFNSSIVSVAEKVEQYPGIKSGNDYLYHVKRNLESSKIDVTILDDTKSKVIDGLEFNEMSIELRMSGVVAKQKYYVTILNNYALCIIVSYDNDEHESALASIIDTIKFE